MFCMGCCNKLFLFLSILIRIHIICEICAFNDKAVNAEPQVQSESSQIK